ncbi:hypothetical protein NCCP691_40630 [Noviherbaspirillum aridicola]|uniref:Uncharacterized protein n=1 Tax=Noviherbaspirillum aridicola TaxID=2849687 RepID=A0ABQ4QBK1_9BURK|nr:hypothetical protein NCCP691_40630 [Noviherbaspirillum aridicola]
MPRRRKIPNRYRCLRPLSWSALALIVAVAYHVMVGASCDLFTSLTKSACQVQEMPWPMSVALWVLGVGGLVGFAYRAYRDFYKGDYWLDHPHF